MKQAPIYKESTAPYCGAVQWLYVGMLLYFGYVAM